MQQTAEEIDRDPTLISLIRAYRDGDSEILGLIGDFLEERDDGRHRMVRRLAAYMQLAANHKETTEQDTVHLNFKKFPTLHTRLWITLCLWWFPLPYYGGLRLCHLSTLPGERFVVASCELESCGLAIEASDCQPNETFYVAENMAASQKQLPVEQRSIFEQSQYARFNLSVFQQLYQTVFVVGDRQQDLEFHLQHLVSSLGWLVANTVPDKHQKAAAWCRQLAEKMARL